MINHDYVATSLADLTRHGLDWKNHSKMGAQWYGSLILCGYSFRLTDVACAMARCDVLLCFALVCCGIASQ